MTTTTIPVDDAEALAERIFADVTTVTEYLAMHLGVQLGLFEALTDGPSTPDELAARADIHPRYAREWLEQLTVAGYLTCDDPAAAADRRRYGMPPAVAAVLADPASELNMSPLLRMIGGVAAVIRDLAQAYRTGQGVPYSAYGEEFRHGLALMNTAAYDAALAGWIAAMPDVHQLLTTTTDPRILDLGCGEGGSTLALARAYPTAVVHGIDQDPASVAAARKAAATAGVAHRVTFAEGDAAQFDAAQVDAAEPVADGPYHLITVLEALHDMGDPVGALRRARTLLAPGGAVFISDQRCPDHFIPAGEVLERFQYGCSTLHCLPATMAEQPVIAHGTVLRAPTVDAWARAAGFDGARRLDIEDQYWQMYRLG